MTIQAERPAHRERPSSGKPVASDRMRAEARLGQRLVAPAIVLMLLCITTFFATYLGFGTQLLAMMLFYVVVSLWFSMHRYKYVRRADQFTMNWPKPQGY